MANRLPPLAVLVVSIAVAGAAHAADLRAVGQNGDSAVYIDIASIQREGDMVRLWAFTAHTEKGLVSPRVYYSEAWQEFDCGKLRGRLSVVREFAKDGKLTNEYKFPESSFQPVHPESIGGMVRQLVCAPSEVEKLPVVTDYRKDAAIRLGQ